MSLQEHLLLNDRKAYALLAAYIGAVRNIHGLPNKAVKALGASIQAIAIRVFKEGAEGDLDKFLPEAIEAAGKAAILLGGSEVAPAMPPLLEALHARAGQIRCSECQSGRVCCGNEVADSEIVAAEEGGACIRDIKTAFQLATEVASEEYARSEFVSFGAPVMMLSTSGRSGPPGQIPGISLAANGYTRFHDDPHVKLSRIEVQVFPLALDRMSLAALPYILLHEVLCHGFQMAGHPGPRANRKAVVDPVAEGLMDALAVELVERRASKAMEDEPGQADLREAEAASARQIHLARASLDMQPPFAQAPEVALGVATLRGIRAVYKQDGDSDPKVGDARRLAYDLNLHGWTYSERIKGLSALVDGLKKRDLTLIGLLLAYRRSHDPSELIDYITKM